MSPDNKRRLFFQRWLSPVQLMAIAVLLASAALSIVYREYALTGEAFGLRGPAGENAGLGIGLRGLSIFFDLLMLAALWGLLRDQWKRLKPKKQNALIAVFVAAAALRGLAGSAFPVAEGSPVLAYFLDGSCLALGYLGFRAVLNHPYGRNCKETPSD